MKCKIFVFRVEKILAPTVTVFQKIVNGFFGPTAKNPNKKNPNKNQDQQVMSMDDDSILSKEENDMTKVHFLFFYSES